MKSLKIVISLVLAFLALSALGNASTLPAKKPKHALMVVLSVPKSVATNPVGAIKKIFGVVLFATETGIDGARVVLTGADKVFDALSIQGKIPVLDQIYAVVSIGAKDAAKADKWLEKQEDSAFGRHN